MFKKSPDPLLLISMILVLMVALTWIVPAGEFERHEVNGRKVVKAGTYEKVEANPQGFWAIFRAPLKGFESAADIAGFILLVGGAFSVITATGAIDAGLHQVLRFSQNNPALKIWIIPLLMGIFSLGGATFGMSEEALIFAMITIPLARSLGYDTIVGAAIPFLGSAMGFASAPFNPFTVGIAQGIAEIPLFSGFEYRSFAWLIYTTLSIVFVMRYARKIDKDPTSSLVYGKPAPFETKQSTEKLAFTTRRKIILGLFLLSLVGIMVGALKYDWYIIELSGLFVLLGVVAAIIGGLNAAEAVKSFVQGAKDLLHTALIIGFAKAILVVATDGKIIDTILHTMSSSVKDLSPILAAEAMFITQGILNFFIPSGSGQAAITMPLMTPLADLMQVSRQTAVLAYQFGDGLFNLIIPTSPVTMGLLELAKIPYGSWIKWIGGFVLVMIFVSMVLLAVPASGWIAW